MPLEGQDVNKIPLTINGSLFQGHAGWVISIFWLSYKLKNIITFFVVNKSVSSISIELVFGNTPPQLLAHRMSICSPPYMSQMIYVTGLCWHQCLPSPHRYYDWPAAISCLHLSEHYGSEQHIALRPVLSEFVLSLPLSIFTEALKSVQHVTTLFPVALPAQQDRGWRRVVLLKG